MSAREDLAEQIWQKAQDLGLNTSPGAGGMHLSQDRKYRSVSFGWARWLDAEVRIYGPRFMLYRDSRERVEKFEDVEALLGYLERVARNET